MTPVVILRLLSSTPDAALGSTSDCYQSEAESENFRAGRTMLQLKIEFQCDSSLMLRMLGISVLLSEVDVPAFKLDHACPFHAPALKRYMRTQIIGC